MSGKRKKRIDEMFHTYNYMVHVQGNQSIAMFAAENDDRAKSIAKSYIKLWRTPKTNKKRPMPDKVFTLSKIIENQLDLFSVNAEPPKKVIKVWVGKPWATDSKKAKTSKQGETW